MSSDVKYDLDNLRHDLSLEETEDSWEKIAKAMVVFKQIGEGGGYDSSPSEVVNALRNSHRAITNALNSERTRLCGPTMDLIASVASGLGHDFDQLMTLFMPPLLTLCGRPNKVVLSRARNTITSIIETTQLTSALTYFVTHAKDKSATLRLVVAEGTLACLNSCNPPDLEKEARARDIESIIRGTARDANPEVRKTSRKIFESYKILLPGRVDRYVLGQRALLLIADAGCPCSFTAPLSPTMKKYLDIKSTTTTLTTSKSTSNLRTNLNLKAEVKPSAPSALSTSTTGRIVGGHSRTASTSTVTGPTASQSRNLATTLTRVSRKEPVHSAVQQFVPIRPTQPSRATSEAQKSDVQRPTPSTTSTAASRPILPQDSKRSAPAPPLRTQSHTISRTATATATTSSSSAPRRLQLLNPETKPAPPAPAQASNAGPRRVPMPPPPPPAPKKDQEAVKRPASRVDNEVSTTRPTVPPAPVKKTTTVASSARERPPTTKPPIPKYKPSSKPAPSVAAVGSSTSVANTKPLAIKAKPTWGGPSTAAPQKVPSKAVVKKPSSLMPKAAIPIAGTSKRRPVTPALVALPPSPTPETLINPDSEADKGLVDAPTSSPVEEQATEDVHEDILPPTLVPEIEVSNDDDTERTIQSYTHTTISPSDTRVPTPTNDTVENASSLEEEKKILDSRELRLPTSNENLPRTPYNNLLPNPSVANATGMAAKTPISALLSSIERGFQYSPTTPLSPADSYLPGPNGVITYSHETHAPRVEGPMQPFNHALHAHGKGTLFATKYGGHEELKCGDIGVVNLSDHDKLYNMPMGLPLLDDGSRHAFGEINK